VAFWGTIKKSTSSWEYIPQGAYFAYIQNQVKDPELVKSFEKIFNMYYESLLNSNVYGEVFRALLEENHLSKDDVVSFLKKSKSSYEFISRNGLF